MQPKQVMELLGKPIQRHDFSDGQFTCLYKGNLSVDYVKGKRGAWIIEGTALKQGTDTLVAVGDSEQIVEQILGTNHNVGETLSDDATYWEYRDRRPGMIVIYFDRSKKVSSVRLAD